MVALPRRREDSLGMLASQKDAGDDEHAGGPNGDAASYSRFSSELQSTDSIHSQQRLCRDRAAQNGHRISSDLEFTDEAVSGTKLRRAGLDALLGAAAAGKFKVLYFYSLSRLARESVISMPMLKQLVHNHKVRVISVSEGVDSEQGGWDLLATLLSMQHERYISDLSQNVLRGQENALLNNYSVGDYCFGFRSKPAPDGQQSGRGRHAKPRMVYAIDQETAQWVHQIFEWFVREKRSIRWIARKLSRQGAPKDHRATTAEWHHQYVTRLLSNRKYIGEWPWGQKKNSRNPLMGQVKQEDRPVEEQEKWIRSFPHLQIIDDDTFEKAQELLAANKEKYAKNRKGDGTLNRGAGSNGHPRHLLSGLIECGNCGATFHVGGANGKYLFCPNYHRGTCKCQTTLQRERGERMILDAIGQRILHDPEWQKEVFDAVSAAWSSLQCRLPTELASAEKQLTTVNRRIETLVDRIEDGASVPELTERLAQRRQEQRELTQTVEQLRRKTQDQGPQPTLEWVQEQLRQLGTVLQSQTPAANEALRSSVGGRIVVEEIREDGRQRHFLRGRFRIDRAASIEMINESPTDTSESLQSEATAEEVVIDFVDPNLLDEQSKQAKAFYDEGLMCAKIAERLGCSRSYVTKLIKHWHESRGLKAPDGRSRRSQLAEKHQNPPL